MMDHMNWFRFADVVLHSILFISTLFMAIRLLINARKYYHYEYEKHKVYTLLTTIGLLVCFPAQMIGIYYWAVNFNAYIQTRWTYYLYFASRALPSIICILTRPDEDCFSCYNRSSPQRYSVFQFSNEELNRLNDDDVFSFDNPDFSSLAGYKSLLFSREKDSFASQPHRFSYTCNHSTDRRDTMQCFDCSRRQTQKEKLESVNDQIFN